MATTDATSSQVLEAQARRLIEDPSAETRADVAASVAREFSGPRLSNSERAMALDIIEASAKDVELQVREALSEHVKNCPFLPPPIAQRLAKDLESVALPILEYSSVLSDKDLIAVVDQGNEAKQIAIARRDRLAAPVSHALVEAGSEQVVGTLLDNQTAEIADRSLVRALEKFPASDHIKERLIERPALPFSVSECLINQVSREWRERLIDQHKIPRALADDLMEQGRERTLIQAIKHMRLSYSAQKDRTAALTRVPEKTMATTDAASSQVLEVQARRLKEDPSVETRADVAASVAREFSGPRLSNSERAMALDIIEASAKDVELQVREALSEHVKNCPFLPPTIARRLAKDVESVALPILEYSSALSDDDLLAVVAQGSDTKQTAIARRDRLGADVSHALVKAGSEQVVGTLLKNDTAEIADHSLIQAIERFPGSDRIKERMIERPMLPLSVSECLINQVSRELRERLIERHEIPHALADELMRQGRERALTESISPDEASSAELDDLAERLHARKRLSPTLLLRALCVGDIGFFKSAMAVLAGVEVDNAGTLIFDKGRRGLEAIYGQSGLPKELFPAFRAAVDVVREVGDESPANRRRLLTDRIVARLELEYDIVCPEGLEHTLSQISRKIIGRDTEIPRNLL